MAKVKPNKNESLPTAFLGGFVFHENKKFGTCVSKIIKSSEEVTSSLFAAVSKEIVYSISNIPNCCVLIIKYRKQIKKTISK